jgi:hypothetical protein
MSRKFAATIITEVEFVDGDDSDQFDQSYLDVLTDGLEKAASSVSTRFIKEEVRVTYCAGGVMRPPSRA